MSTPLIQSIRKISNEITKSVFLEDTIDTIMNEMIKNLSSIGGAVMLVHPEEKMVRTYRLSNTIPGKFMESIAKKYNIPMQASYSKPDTFIAKAVIKKKIMKGHQVSDFISPPVSKRLCNAMQKLAGIKTVVAAPCIMQDEVLGLICVAFEDNEEDIPNEIWNLMSIFIDQATIAINNALKYEEILKQYETERETTSILSHELKTPIAIAHNNLQLIELLLAEGGDPQRILNKLEKIHEELKIGVKRMDQICNSIFSLREVENEVPALLQKLNLEHALIQTLEIYKFKAHEEGLKFNYKISIKSKDHYGAGVQFEQILTILLDNAIKYTIEGAIDVKVVITTKHMKAVVTDTGIGIEQKHRKNVFERFRFFSHSRKKGEKVKKKQKASLGLGLYIARTILEKLDGEIKMEENPKGQGTQFTFSLPVYNTLNPKIPKKKSKNRLKIPELPTDSLLHGHYKSKDT